MKSRTIVLSTAGILIIILLIIISQEKPRQNQDTYQQKPVKVEENLFAKDVIIEESSLEESPHESWWLNSGAYFYIKDQVGRTVQGNVGDSKWRPLYDKTSPVDTENGRLPQNLFRLIYKKKMTNPDQAVCFKINKINTTGSQNRNQSNGIFLFSRYVDSDNLYYVGLRVDGNMVIKKKINGGYKTLALKKILPGTYEKQKVLLPQNQWLGIKSRIEERNGETLVRAFYNSNCPSGNWQEVTNTLDSGDNTLNSGSEGIRTDFMDAEFSEYKVSEI